MVAVVAAVVGIAAAEIAGKLFSVEEELLAISSNSSLFIAT